MRKTIVAIAVVLCACDEPTALSNLPEPSIREARPVPTPPAITVISLGTMPYSGDRSYQAMGLGLNNGSTRSQTRVAGFASYDVIHQHPMTWTLATGMSPIKPEVPTTGWGKGVSDNGIVVGDVSFPNTTFGFVASADYTVRYLPYPVGTMASTANAISADGVCMVGSYTTGDGTFAALWRNGLVQAIGTGVAYSVSDDCTLIAGTHIGATLWSWNGTAWIEESLPFRDAGKTYADGRKASSQANDLSPNGEYIAGFRVDSVGQYAVVWRRVNGAWVPVDMPGNNYQASGVDNNGRAVGQAAPGEAVLWTGTSSGSYTAQKLPPLEKSTISWASAINELGQITGRSRTRKGDRAVLWTVN